jgi:hypothetical protein
MKATLTLDDKEYKINLNKLIQLGLIEDTDANVDSEPDLDEKIEHFNTGDVFQTEFNSVLIIECNNYYSDKMYQIAGLNGLKVYSDFDGPVDFDTMLDFLNEDSYKFVKNINDDIHELIKVV